MTLPRLKPRSTHRARLAPVLAALLVLGTACSGGEEDEATPEETLASAKTQLDETSGVRLALTTDALPPKIDGILKATGSATHDPAFEGNLTVLVNELTVEVPVIALEGAVFAKLPFTTEYAEINPADYGAPDPAALLDPADGISAWLTAAEGVKRGEQTRDGQQVLTSYTGTIPGASVAEVIPSADESADFEATFRIDDEDRLGSVDVTGPFYGTKGEVAYSIKVTDYGTEPDIKRP